MTAAPLSKEENTVLIFAGQILSELLNNDAFISLHVVSLISHASSCNSRCCWQDLHLETADEISSCVYHCFEPCLHRHGSVARCIVLLEHKWVLLIPEHLLYWLQQITNHEVNVKIQFDISFNHYQIANARMLMHPQTITGTIPRSRNRFASGFILYFSNIISPTSFTFIISV